MKENELNFLFIYFFTLILVLLLLENIYLIAFKRIFIIGRSYLVIIYIYMYVYSIYIYINLLEMPMGLLCMREIFIRKSNEFVQ